MPSIENKRKSSFLTTIALFFLTPMSHSVAQQSVENGGYQIYVATPRVHETNAPVLMDLEQFRKKSSRRNAIQEETGDDETGANNGSIGGREDETSRSTTDGQGDSATSRSALSSVPIGIAPDLFRRATEKKHYNIDFVQQAYHGFDYAQPSCGFILTTWRTPNMFHGPLYFQDENLERYGNSRGLWQPLYSSVHFFGNVALLPYHRFANPPGDCDYSMGYYRPGNCNPAFASQFQWSRRGVAAQSLAVGGIVAGL